MIFNTNAKTRLMNESASREKILQKTRNALIHKPAQSQLLNVDFESPVYTIAEEEPEVLFAHKFTSLTGKFAFCEHVDEFEQIFKEFITESGYGEVFCTENKLKDILQKAGIKYNDNADQATEHKATLTFCEYLIARTGSIMISSRQASGRKQAVFPDTHIVVAFTSQLVDDIKDALKAIKIKYGENSPSMISLISGPSRTADIEKTLVLGAHGPKEIFVFLIDDTPKK